MYDNTIADVERKSRIFSSYNSLPNVLHAHGTYKRITVREKNTALN